MALPPGFLEELRDRVSLSDVAGRKVTWDRKKSNPAKGDWWAPCPFHQEKTPSFHVDDRKGFYYCFGCHAKGDAISFVKELENVSFIEAVRILAGDAGMPMPEQDPQAQEREDARAKLVDAMEAAVQFFRMNLRSAKGRETREYLVRRGLTEETVDRFELGYAPDARHALIEHLTQKGLKMEALVEAGLVIQPEEGGRPFDRFRGRLMFPIRDARGRCIAFGARAMDPNARAKYLNSPETPLFSKSRTLYNHGPAREAAGKAGALIAAEGYMDVIALAQAGFDHAVAPLGTAVTEDQVRMMWRMADEPVIALDGDKAGQRAAEKVIDVAAPMLEAGKGLRFCILPDGRDPDELIRSGGPGAMREALKAALPMVDLLWRREVEGKIFDSPERRAALDKSLKEALARISDPLVREHYHAAIKEKRAELFAPKSAYGGGAQRFTPNSGGYRGGPRGFGSRGGSGGGRGGKFNAWQAPAHPTAETRNSLLARQGGGDTEARGRESVILATLLSHPDLVEKLDSEIAALNFTCPDLDAMRTALLSAAVDVISEGAAVTEDALAQRVAARLGADPREALARVPLVGQMRYARRSAPIESAERGLRDVLARHVAQTARALEAGEAEAAAPTASEDHVTERLRATLESELEANKLPEDDGGATDHDASELQRFIDERIWVKKTNRRDSGRS